MVVDVVEKPKAAVESKVQKFLRIKPWFDDNVEYTGKVKIFKPFHFCICDGLAGEERIIDGPYSVDTKDNGCKHFNTDKKLI